MKYKLTQDDVKDYVRGKYNKCPFCDSQDIEGHSWDYNGDWVSQEVTCIECGGCWEDIYSLCHMRVISYPEKPEDVHERG